MLCEMCYTTWNMNSTQLLLQLQWLKFDRLDQDFALRKLGKVLCNCLKINNLSLLVINNH